MKNQTCTLTKLLVVLCLIPTVTLDLDAQYVPTLEQGDPTYRRRSEIEANAVRTSVYNFSFSGRTGVGQGIPYEWPNSTGRHYIALAGMFVGGEVVNAIGNTIQIVSVPAYRADPVTGADWNFNPVPQYMNPISSTIARSDDPTTWPPFWPDKMIDTTDPGWVGKWNGLLGKDMFINGTEYYYHSSDNVYDRYLFFPDSVNMWRRGLGIVVSQRVLEWRDPILEDAVVTVSDVYNVGTHAIARTALTFWVADFVGGDGDSQDDKAYYNLSHKIVYFTDADGFSPNPAFAGARVGVAALAFLQTPADSAGLPLGITNMSIVPAGAINFTTTPDSYFWSTFMTPGQFFNPNTIPPGENDIFASCGYFPLPARASKRLVTAFVFAMDTVEALRRVNYVRGLVGGGYSPNSVGVSILSPIPGQVVSGQVPIQWNAANNRPSLRVDLFHSSNLGDTWNLIAQNEPNDGSYTWATQTLPDGVFFKIRVVAYDSVSVGYRTTDSVFTLNNPQASPPQIRISSPLSREIHQSPVIVRWLGGDPDGDPVSISLHHRLTGVTGWTTIDSGLPNNGTYAWNTTSLPNSSSYQLSADITDGTIVESDTVLFEIQNPRYALHDSAFVQRSAVGTGLIQVRITNPAQVNGHTYGVSFALSPDTITTYNVVDQNTGGTVVSGATQVNGTAEGPLFDGIRLFIRNDSLALDTAHSHWNRPEIHSYAFELFNSGFTVGFRELADYALEVGSVGFDTSTAITIEGVPYPSRPVNFQIRNSLSGQRVPFAFFELDGSDGRFTADPIQFVSDFVVVLKRIQQDSLVPTWLVWMNPHVSRVNPQAGDNLTISLFKPFQTGDLFRFTAIAGGLLHVPEANPRTFALEQNFPNPFNPATNIRFSIGGATHVELQIYDILGRRVRALLNAPLPAGEHQVVWDGRNDHGNHVASGIYLYRITAGSFVSVKKMLMLR